MLSPHFRRAAICGLAFKFLFRVSRPAVGGCALAPPRSRMLRRIPAWPELSARPPAAGQDFFFFAAFLTAFLAGFAAAFSAAFLARACFSAACRAAWSAAALRIERA